MALVDLVIVIGIMAASMSASTLVWAVSVVLTPTRTVTATTSVVPRACGKTQSLDGCLLVGCGECCDCLTYTSTTMWPDPLHDPLRHLSTCNPTRSDFGGRVVKVIGFGTPPKYKYCLAVERMRTWYGPVSDPF